MIYIAKLLKPYIYVKSFYPDKTLTTYYFSLFLVLIVFKCSCFMKIMCFL